MSSRDEISDCSTLAIRILVGWCILEGLIQLGIWFTRWSWLRWAENTLAVLAIFFGVWIDFRISQIAQVAIEGKN
jgi:hypothetical protein